MRNILFKSIFFSGLILICIIFLPSLLLPKKITLFGGKLFGYWSSFCLKIFYSTSIVIKGQENIINNILIPEYIYDKLKNKYSGPDDKLDTYLWIIIYRYQLLGSNNNQLGVLPTILFRMKNDFG